MKKRIGLKTRILMVELGMLGGIIVALYTVPSNTRLSIFLIASGLCFAFGNIMLFLRFRREKGETVEAKNSSHHHSLRALAILAAGWILVWLARKL